MLAEKTCAKAVEISDRLARFVVMLAGAVVILRVTVEAIVNWSKP